jgi:hypothetical protein
MGIQMNEEKFEELIKEVRQMGARIEELQQHSAQEYVGPLMKLKEAAEYTARSESTFRKEFELGYWTNIKMTGGGHPRFSKMDLDRDMEPWRINSSYKHKHRGRKKKAV